RGSSTMSLPLHPGRRYLAAPAAIAEADFSLRWRAINRRTPSPTARSARDRYASRAVIKPNRRGGTSRSATRRTRVSSGGIAVSGRTDAPPPAATMSPINRMPSTSTGTAMLSPLAAAASPTSRRGGFPPGGRVIGSSAGRAGGTGPCPEPRARRRLGPEAGRLGGDEPDERLVEQVLDLEAGRRHRLRDDRLSQLPGQDL